MILTLNIRTSFINRIIQLVCWRCILRVFNGGLSTDEWGNRLLHHYVDAIIDKETLKYILLRYDYANMIGLARIEHWLRPLYPEVRRSWLQTPTHWKRRKKLVRIRSVSVLLVLLHPNKRKRIVQRQRQQPPKRADLNSAVEAFAIKVERCVLFARFRYHSA